MGISDILYRLLNLISLVRGISLCKNFIYHALLDAIPQKLTNGHCSYPLHLVAIHCHLSPNLFYCLRALRVFAKGNSQLSWTACQLISPGFASAWPACMSAANCACATSHKSSSRFASMVLLMCSTLYRNEVAAQLAHSPSPLSA